MSNWKTCTISDLGTVVGGATPSTKNLENYNGGKIAWITPKDLSCFNRRFISHGERNITELGLKGCSAQLLPPHAVLFSSRAPIGYIAIAEKSVCTNQGFKSVIPNENTDYLFLYYLLKYNKNRIENLGSGTTFKEVSASTMRGIEVTVPESKEEQHKIASFLGMLDDKIENNTQINDNLQEQAFALFDNLYSKANYGGCALNQIAELNPKRQISKGVTARCIEMSHLSTSGSFPNGWTRKLYNGGMKFKNGDTIMARITPCLENGKTSFINFLNESEVAFGSTEYIVITSRGEYPPEFFYCLARYPAFVDYAVKNMNGSSGRQRVSADVLGNFSIPKLSREQINQFSNVVPSLFETMRINSLEILFLTELRNNLLSRLMSGELVV